MLFSLRSEHLQGFETAAIENFEDRGVKYLRENPPGDAATKSDEELRLRIRGSIVRARPYGLTTERQVMSFVSATFLAGERFDTSFDWARGILGNRHNSPDDKAQLVLLFAHVQRGAS